MSSRKDTTEDDERYETEEILVYVDLDTKLLDNQLTKSNPKIRFLGIDTENPIMQLNDQLFKGSFDYSMGTHCFFSQSNRPGSGEDACFNELPDKIYEYLAKTDKVLKMRRIFVEEKESETNSELVEGEIEDLEHLRITKTYAEALNQFLKPGEQPPREIIQESESDDEEEEENKMEVENIEEMPIILQQPDQQLDEELPDEEPSESQSETQSDTRTEDSENTKNAKIEAVVQQEFEKLTDPSQFS